MYSNSNINQDSSELNDLLIVYIITFVKNYVIIKMFSRNRN